MTVPQNNMIRKQFSAAWYPELWGCVIFGTKTKHLPIKINDCKFHLYSDISFSDQKWSISPNMIFFREKNINIILVYFLASLIVLISPPMGEESKILLVGKFLPGEGTWGVILMIQTFFKAKNRFLWILNIN